MANKYEVGENPIQDFLFQLMMLNYDITAEESKDTIEETIIYLLDSMGVESKYLKYLDYDIQTVKNEHVKVIPENFVTALWFSGIIPLDCDLTEKNNELRYNGKICKFNYETKKILWKKLEK